jgi:hypothetical protein
VAAQDRPAPNTIWQPLNGLVNLPPQAGIPAQARAFQLKRAALEQVLNQAPPESSHAVRPLLPLPLPDGKFVYFQLEASPSLEPDLAARFPDIKSFRGYAVDDTAMTMRGDLSPRGFHAFILAGAELINVQPVSANSEADYVSFSSAVPQEGSIQCLVRDIHNMNPANLTGERALAPDVAQVAVGPTRRNYRIAIAATWEYCNQYGGGTNAGTVASLNTWLNAANLIYERDVAVHLNLVNDTDVFYTSERGFSAGSDPYDNSDVGQMLNQVRSDLRDKVGSANYDVGHVLGQLGGLGASGVAYVGVVCSNSDFDGQGPLKGGGATLVGGSAGNNIALGVWVHELGHQFGANHSFNGTQDACAAPSHNNATSWETGGGSTIMAYPSICGEDNITNTRDMRFHAGSYAEITSYIAGSATCFTNTSTGNSAPTVNGGGDYTIPRQTPFTLTATGGDPNSGDVPNLTYTWDQIDAGGSQFPQNGSAASYNDASDPPTTTRPIFRSFAPSASPSRTFPSLTYILNNANDPPDMTGSFKTAEELPRIGRSLNFRVLIRDNRAGGGGVNEDSVLLTVAGNAGPFHVTAPNTTTTWTGGSTQTVTWDVSNTNVAPVGCGSVRILASTDGGGSFPYVLASNTPNDGSATVTAPNVASTTVRIKVEAIGNIFFDISDANLTIAPNCTATQVNPSSQSFAANGGAGQMNVQTGPTCPWTATSNAPSWITITGGGTGVGNGTVSYSVAAHSGNAPRSGTITVTGGATFTVLQGANFADVPPGHLFYTEIGKLSARGITSGCTSSNYCPDANVTREQMAVFLIRALGDFNPPTPPSQRFADVPPSHPFYAFIDQMAVRQITTGCGGGNYCPTSQVTREQMAIFIIRALGELNPPNPPFQRFSDVGPERAGYRFIDRMAVLGITSGCTASLYCPDSAVTRAQMAVFLVRAFNL